MFLLDRTKYLLFKTNFCKISKYTSNKLPERSILSKCTQYLDVSQISKFTEMLIDGHNVVKFLWNFSNFQTQIICIWWSIPYKRNKILNKTVVYFILINISLPSKLLPLKTINYGKGPTFMIYQNFIGSWGYISHGLQVCYIIHVRLLITLKELSSYGCKFVSLLMRVTHKINAH